MQSVVRKIGLVLAAVLLVATPAAAQTVQTLQLGAGIFFPRGLDSRHDDDVLLRNALGETLADFPTLTDAIAFEMSDFRGGHFFGEWNVGFGDRVEVGAGVGFYRRSVPTVYYDLVDEFERDIEQRLSLRIVPVTGIVRFMPFGTPGDVQPYVGAGLALLNYRYSEAGDFVDPDTLEIYPDRYNKSGTTLGGLLLGGVRFPIGGDIYGLGIEGRYQFGTGDTGGADEGFLADKIDLSGGQLNFTFLVRF
jgi:hypothetical protein